MDKNMRELKLKCHLQVMKERTCFAIMVHLIENTPDPRQIPNSSTIKYTEETDE